MLYPLSKIPNLTCVYSLSHTQFVYACFKPDLGWCHMQLLHGWQTVSAPQHGALWSACQADRQVNDTNENQPSLPLGARHWVTASKQPKSVSEPESNLFNSLFLFFCTTRHSFSFFLAFLFLSLALPRPRSLFSKKSLFLFRWVFFPSTEGLCLFSLPLLLPSLSPLDSVCHCSVLFSIPVSPSLKERLDCLSGLSLKSKLGWKVCKNRVEIGTGL